MDTTLERDSVVEYLMRQLCRGKVFRVWPVNAVMRIIAPLLVGWADYQNKVVPRVALPSSLRGGNVFLYRKKEYYRDVAQPL
ncbi:MAG: hypothetical protein ACYDER_09045 [Ktedonobacteraceae bacterium]